MKSLLKPARELARYSRTVIYGADKTGKTRIGLSAPKVAVFDTEDSTKNFAHQFDFFASVSQSLDDLDAVIDYLMADGRKEHETFLLDSGTTLHSNLVAWGTGGDGRVSYDKWAHIHNVLEALWNRLALLPMHVIVTAHEATRYTPLPGGGKGIQRDGIKPDADPALLYFPDVVIRTVRTDNGKREYGGYFEHIRGIDLPKPVYRPNITFDMILKAMQFGEQKAQASASPNGQVAEPATQSALIEEPAQ